MSLSASGIITHGNVVEDCSMWGGLAVTIAKGCLSVVFATVTGIASLTAQKDLSTRNALTAKAWRV